MSLLDGFWILLLIAGLFFIFEYDIYAFIRQRNRKKYPYSWIEPKVKSLVDNMNIMPNITTIASCQGHCDGRSPYVYFKAPTEIVANIERELRADSVTEEPRLHYFWTLTGHFNEKYELCFRLSIPDLDKNPNFLQRLKLGLFRQKIDKDFLSLTKIIENSLHKTILCHKIKNTDKVRDRIKSSSNNYNNSKYT